MTNPIASWWRSRQFRTALKSNSISYANQLLEEIQRSRARLSLLERVFRDKLQCDQHSDDYKREVLALRQQVGEALDQKQELERSLEQTQQAVESLFRDKQQAEQSVAELHEQLRQNQQEATLVQQQLEIRRREVQSLEEQLNQKQTAHEQHIQDLRRWRSEVYEQKQKLEQLIVQKQRGVENLSRSEKAERSLAGLRQEVENLHRQLSQKQQESAENQQQLEENKQQISKLREQLERTVSSTLVPHPLLLESISQVFNFNLRPEDPNMLQCTGIDEVVFGQLEGNLVNYLQSCLRESSIPSLRKAHREIRRIGSGRDPDYSFELIDHAYLMEYFLNNAYCSYIAWFLVYKSNLLKQNLKILDIAAGPATVLHGLATFLESLSRNLLPLEEIHICYHWLEQQKYFQNISTDLWEQNTVSGHAASNSYWRLDNSNLFNSTNQLPDEFFDFIVICHCFFWDRQDSNNSLDIYRRVCQNNLKSDGYALFVIQQYKLFGLFDQVPNKESERGVIEEFVRKMGLSIEWFRFLSSTGVRGRFRGNFNEFADQNLPLQRLMSPLKQRYLGISHSSNYSLDDYVILARKGED